VKRIEFDRKVKSILESPKGFGVTIFTCFHEKDRIVLKKLQIIDDSQNEIGDIIKESINEKYMKNNIEFEDVSNLHDNKLTIYSIQQSDTYSPFSFLLDSQKITEAFNEKTKDNLFGFAFRFNLNNTFFWAYQQAYSMNILKAQKGMFLFNTGKVFAKYKNDLVRIDCRVDMLIIDNYIVTDNLKLLQSKFNFDKLIREEAEKTISSIGKLGIINNMDKLMCFEAKQELTNSKKLMKISKSPVLKMDKFVLLKKLESLSRYKDKFKIVNNEIIIKTNKDIIELLKMLNDDYLVSELTGQEYDSSAKDLLEVKV